MCKCKNTYFYFLFCIQIVSHEFKTILKVTFLILVFNCINKFDDCNVCDVLMKMEVIIVMNKKIKNR